MKEPVKNKKTFLLAMILLISLASFACSRLTPGAAATPTSDYIFTPSTVLLKIEPASLPNGQVDVAYEADIRVRDNVTPLNSMSISDGSLPAGLELVFVDGEDGATISGVPTETGTFTFTVFVTCFGTMVSGQTGEMEYTIVVE